MKVLLVKYWDRIGSSFWFVPALMVVSSAVLSFAMVAADQSLDNEALQASSWAYTGDADGANAVLSVIASSMVTIVGLVFSLTLVALSLAASQFGPRVLRNFMRDTTNQVVLGTFVATFLYCLLVLKTIRRADGIGFVPHLSVTLGIVMVLGSLGVLIYFIHHIAVSMQADELVKRIAAELLERVEQLFPEQVEAATDGPMNERERAFTEPEKEGFPVRSRCDGYLQLIDTHALTTLATEHDMLIRSDQRPGDYVFEGTVLALVWSPHEVNEKLTSRLEETFVLGGQRTGVQDIEFTVNQLVEIAVRALSPGLNDPFTAVTCIDRLGSMLRSTARREMPSRHRYDEQGRLRIILPHTSFARLLDVAFDQIRHYGRDNFVVCLRLLETLAAIASTIWRPEDAVALARHAARVARAARDGLEEPDDRQAIESCYAELSKLLARQEGQAVV